MPKGSGKEKTGYKNSGWQKDVVVNDWTKANNKSGAAIGSWKATAGRKAPTKLPKLKKK